MHCASQTNAGAQRTEKFTICGCLVDPEVIDSIINDSQKSSSQK